MPEVRPVDPSVCQSGRVAESSRSLCPSETLRERLRVHTFRSVVGAEGETGAQAGRTCRQEGDRPTASQKSVCTQARLKLYVSVRTVATCRAR